MNLAQLRSLCEIVDCGLRISHAAKTLYRSQPSVTRQIQELENELGFEIFIRNRNRILAITPDGEKIIDLARRMLGDAENMKRISAEASNLKEGRFTISTTHTQAHYSLAKIIGRFLEKYPKVQLSLVQGTPARCCELVMHGYADIAICSEPIDPVDNLVSIPCYRMNRGVLAPVGHPVLEHDPLTIADLCKYPIITYDNCYSGSWIVSRTFADAGLSPNIVLSVIDAVVSKVYARQGLGIVILTDIVYDPEQDRDLAMLEARHLFPANTLNIFMRKRSHLRGYMFDFMSMFAPHLRRKMVQDYLFGDRVPAGAGAKIPDIRDFMAGKLG